MALLEKDLPHTLEFVDILAGENYEPWFVRINPNCEVPVLKHGGKIVSGSDKIIEYLEETFTQGTCVCVCAGFETACGIISNVCIN